MRELSSLTVWIRKLVGLERLKCIIKRSFLYRDYVGYNNPGLYSVGLDRFHCISINSVLGLCEG